MTERKALLDHGYLFAVEHWGSDERVIEAARMSTDKGFLGWGPRCKNCKRNYGNPSEPAADVIPVVGCVCGSREQEFGDEKLLRYLWEHNHATPFEMAGLTIEVQAPIFVFREWHRHRVPFGYNELSARYTPMPATDYVPTVDRLLVNGGTNKQAGTAAGARELDHDAANDWLGQLEQLQRHAQEVYEAGLRAGVPKELARLAVTVGRYSRMRATGNLRGWLGFCKLRCAPNAQYEIRVFANAVGEILAKRFPRTWSLFAEGQR